MQDDPWAGLLNPGERILWQGQPDAKPDFRALKPLKLAVGAVFAAIGMSVCGMGLVRIGGGEAAGLIPALFGLVFVAAGAQGAGQAVELIEEAAPEPLPEPVADNRQADAISALVNLGYSMSEAATAVARAAQDDPEAGTAHLIRAGLKSLAPKG
ncbi:Holliday junction ATP-dependent DNA helicase RuvA [Mangrovicoccus ximenensis]|uniref:hypothetical protein n=1 Tax=Mangrovicoccus ximenensis TaxID=1911570 RepID=UPI0038B2C95F